MLIPKYTCALPDKLTGTLLTRQTLFFVAICLIMAEILIFVPSATQFQHRWFETQWQHFLMQFEKEGESTLPALALSYETATSLSSTHFHAPDFVCWKDDTGTDVTIGHLGISAAPFDLAADNLRHIPLALSIMIGQGPDHVIVYDSRNDEDFRATWQTSLIRAHLQNYAVRIALLTLLIGLFIIAPLYWFLHRQIVHPLMQISAHMRRFASDPSQIMEPLTAIGTNGEISQIASALEQVTEDLRRALRQKERLADIGEATAKINHDLRNILVSATLVTDTLKSSDDPKIQRIAPHIERAITDAASMTQNMMDYLSEAKPEEAMRFTLAEMAENLHHDTKLAITTHGPDSLTGMPNTLYRLLLNLARNAQRAGATSLTIDVWRAGHLGVIDISDNGPGIDASLHPHLFSAFYSGHSKDTGLGLAIAKDLSVAMGGELRLSRSSPDGSEFRLSVPANWLTDKTG